jgi:ABC-2 type transport system permease protein
MQDILLYPKLFVTFARNSLIRDMTFRTNFVIEVVSSIAWMAMNLGFYLLVYQYTQSIEGWGKYEFFIFIATTMFINSIVQALFMPNAQEISELVRTGGLDFAMLKPIDTQFLLSMRKINWSSLGNVLVAFGLLVYAEGRIDHQDFTWVQYFLYPFYVVCGVLILYSIMISLSATSIWLGRNQSLYDFWFYITNFSRYPLEIYGGNALGDALRIGFTYIVPVLVVVNVPARMMAKPLTAEYAWLAGFAFVATIVSLVLCRLVFQSALASYRSASS